jgi:hypothetical protein
MEGSNTKPIIILWGIEITGHKNNVSDFIQSPVVPFIDCYLEVDLNNPTESIEQLKGIELRARFNPDRQLALFHIPKDMTREDFTHYFKIEQLERLLEKLKAAKVTFGELVRKREFDNSIDFIKHEG